jgi:hypothetical protein
LPPGLVCAYPNKERFTQRRGVSMRIYWIALVVTHSPTYDHAYSVRPRMASNRCARTSQSGLPSLSQRPGCWAGPAHAGRGSPAEFPVSHNRPDTGTQTPASSAPITVVSVRRARFPAAASQASSSIQRHSESGSGLRILSSSIRKATSGACTKGTSLPPSYTTLTDSQRYSPGVTSGDM